MTSSPDAVVFRFDPSWDCLEQFLRTYADLDAMKARRTIDIIVAPDFFSVLPGYPNRARNAYLTLDYAVHQMNRSYFSGKSLVDCIVVPPHQGST